jgi:hypothetical protein
MRSEVEHWTGDFGHLKPELSCVLTFQLQRVPAKCPSNIYRSLSAKNMFAIKSVAASKI